MMRGKSDASKLYFDISEFTLYLASHAISSGEASFTGACQCVCLVGQDGKNLAVPERKEEECRKAIYHTWLDDCLQCYSTTQASG